MDTSLFMEVIKLIILLPIMIVLIFITFKYGGKYMGKFNGNKVIRVYERVALSQNTFLSVVSINNKVYVMTNGEKGAEILLELDESILAKYDLKNGINKDFISEYISKLKIYKRKDDK